MNQNPRIGVLIFPAGEINSVELHDALSTCVNIRLYGASSVDRHGAFVFKNYISDVPMITSPLFIDAFNNILENFAIDVIIPTHDDIALFLAQKQDLLKATVLTSDIKTAEICRDKKATFELFADSKFCSKIYDGFTHLPVFIKPRKGQGGVGTKIINSTCDIPSEYNLADNVICEYLPGVELTVDCLTDKDGHLKVILPRTRQRVFGGVSVRSQNEPLTNEIRDIAMTINSRLSFLGLWYFQIKQDRNGYYKLLEISVRCAGTMCLSRTQGVNLPLLSVYTAMGYKTDILCNDFDILVDRTLISRYKTTLNYKRVYIDLDDTIIIENKVNLQAIRFLYQCVNEGKFVSLITRHCVDHTNSVKDALSILKISYELFDEIIELDTDTPKSSVIKPDYAIFIDNTYSERKAVYDISKIPVFDVDGIEVLLDWRM